MSTTAIWLVAALILLGLEMASGTFYLLVVAGALAVGGLAAWAGVGTVGQFALAALLGFAGILALRAWRRRNPGPAEASGQNLDFGLQVHLVQRLPEGGLQVRHRGSVWQAELATADTDVARPLYIVGQQASILILANHKPN